MDRDAGYGYGDQPNMDEKATPDKNHPTRISGWKTQSRNRQSYQTYFKEIKETGFFATLVNKSKV